MRTPACCALAFSAIASLTSMACRPSEFDEVRPDTGARADAEAGAPAFPISGSGDAQVAPRSQIEASAPVSAVVDAGARDATNPKPSISEPPKSMTGAMATMIDGGRPFSEEAGAGDARVEPPSVPSCPSSCTTAAHATGTCVAGTCRWACGEGYGDCDVDLALAGAGNGCEVQLASDVAHCGRCDRACTGAGKGLPRCTAGRCESVMLRFGAATPKPSHGTPHTTPPMSQQCAEGSVVTGIEGFVADGTVADSMRVLCSPLSLRFEHGLSVAVGTASADFPLVGGLEWDRYASAHAPYALLCPAGQIVGEVQVSTWLRWSNEAGSMYPTIKDLAIRCAEVRVEDDQVVVGPLGAPLQTSATQESTRATIQVDACGAGGAIAGFRMSAVVHLDDLTTLCTSLAVAVDVEGGPP